MVAGEPHCSLEPENKGSVANSTVRFSAWIIDFLILMGVFVPVGVFLLIYGYAAYGNPVGSGYSAEELTVLWCVPIAASVSFGFWRIYRLVVTGQSPGMRRVGIAVVRVDNGERLSFSRAFVRVVLPPAALVLGLVGAIAAGLDGPLWGALLWLVLPAPALWDRLKRGWHDRLAGAIVVVTDSSE